MARYFIHGMELKTFEDLFDQIKDLSEKEGFISVSRFNIFLYGYPSNFFLDKVPSKLFLKLKYTDYKKTHGWRLVDLMSADYVEYGEGLNDDHVIMLHLPDPDESDGGKMKLNSLTYEINSLLANDYGISDLISANRLIMDAIEKEIKNVNYNIENYDHCTFNITKNEKGKERKNV